MIEETMLNDRIITLYGEVNVSTSKELILELLYLDSLNNDDIYLYINSPGGDVYQGLAIIDTMNYINSKVITIVIGIAYSMAAIILASGNTRYSLPHSEIMIHEPLGNASGKATEISASTKRIEETRLILASILKTKTKKTLTKIMKDIKTDHFLTPKEAQNYGIIDKIINSKSN